MGNRDQAVSRISGAAALIVCTCVALSGAAQSAPPRVAPAPLKIVGINPLAAEIGGIVEVRLTGLVSRDAAVVVDGVYVRPLPDTTAGSTTGTLVLSFGVPTSVLPGTKVDIVVVDGPVQSDRVPLAINPLRILSVSPSAASAGTTIELTLSTDHPRLGEAGVQFSGSDGKPVTRAVQHSKPGSISTIVPAGLMSEVRLAVLFGGVSSVPFDGFVVRARWLDFVYRASSFWPTWIGLSLALMLATVAARQGLIPQAWIPFVKRATPSREDIDPAAIRDIPPLRVPEPLVDACADGNCVLYIGAGVSATANLPTWRPFVTDLLNWAVDTAIIGKSAAADLEAALANGSVDRVADEVVAAVIDKKAADAMSVHLRSQFIRNTSVTEVHHLLAELPFTAVMTTNFDRLMERAYADNKKTVSVFVPADVDHLKTALVQSQPFLLKLYGDLDRPDSVVIGPAQYDERIQSDKSFADFMQQVFFTRTILFLGASIDGIEAYLKGLRFRPSPTVRHYALVAVTRAGWQTDANSLSRRYGIEVVPYDPSGNYKEMFSFVRELHRDVTNRVSYAAAVAPTPIGTEWGRLKSLTLRHVGPFDEIQVAFKQQWTILLGDNGVGKSTILKAIAVSVAGERAGAAAGRLLQTGREKSPPSDEPPPAAEISLTTQVPPNGKVTPYETRISLDRVNHPEVESIGPRAFADSVLVIAFPAIRTIASGPTRGAQLTRGNRSPSPDDVLPMLGAAPDPRILDFKQWIVNLDYRRRNGGDDAPRVTAILDAFMKTMSELLGGMPLGPVRVVKDDVEVHSKDGWLPLDALSQGTVSILGWVGVLTQRLIEATGSVDSPALILIDEIDAHMHPEWQQTILKNLGTAFPKAQFVVTTHSPFLAVGREAGEIVRLRRDRDGSLSAEPVSFDTKFMTVADVLTSHLFGLRSQLHPDLEEDVLKYRGLIGQAQLTPKERSDLAELERRLGPVGVASSHADPLVGRVIEEVSRAQRQGLAAASVNPADEKRRKEIVAEIATEVLKNGPKGAT